MSHLDSHYPTQDPLVENVVLLGGYALRALRRRALLAATSFLATVGLTLLFLAIASPVYRVRTVIVTAPSEIMTRLTAPGRMIIPGEKPPMTQGATEALLSREMLTYVVDKLDLVRKWKATRTPVGRVVDTAFGTVFGRPTQSEEYESVVRALADAVNTEVTDNTIALTVEWHEPTTALAIAKTIEERFLSQRRDTELNQIKDTYAILQGRVDAAAKRLSAAEAALRTAADHANATNARLFDQRRKDSPDLQTIARLEHTLESKREALRRMETAFDHRVSEAQAHLNELRATLGPNHPDVADARRALALQSRPPPELAGMRHEEEDLANRLSQLAPSMTAAGLFRNLVQTAPVDPDLEAAMSTYHQRAAEHDELQKRLEAAGVELATATAAFDFHYKVTQPPLLPHRKAAPNTFAVALAGTAAALVLAFVLAVLADLASRRIQEPWQIARFIGIPVLAQIRRV